MDLGRGMGHFQKKREGGRCGLLKHCFPPKAGEDEIHQGEFVGEFEFVVHWIVSDRRFIKKRT
jgi:hypothetical protein